MKLVLAGLLATLSLFTACALSDSEDISGAEEEQGLSSGPASSGSVNQCTQIFTCNLDGTQFIGTTPGSPSIWAAKAQCVDYCGGAARCSAGPLVCEPI